MTRWLLLILLTLFQDSFVRFGTLLGLAAGYGSLLLMGGEPWSNMSAYGFIGWGVGAYLGHHRSGKTPESLSLIHISEPTRPERLGGGGVGGTK